MRSRQVIAALCALFALSLFALAAGIPAGADETPGTTPVPWIPTPNIERSPIAAPTNTPPDPGGGSGPPPIHTDTPFAADTPVPTTDHTATAVPGGGVGEAHPVTPIVPPAGAGAAAAPTTQAAGTLPNATPTPIPTRTRIPTPTPTAPPPTATTTPTPAWSPPGPECNPKPGKTVFKLDVPFIHQVNDIGAADGNWACGPTSVAMVLAYYGKLDPWQDYVADRIAAGVVTAEAKLLTGSAGATPPVTRQGQPANTGFAPYVTNRYTLNGHTYEATGPDPRGNRVAGLYGTICPGGLADWGRMASVIQWHGLSSRHISTSWESIVAALKRGHPVIVSNNYTPAGHILVIIGYTNNGHLIVNDPYGNRFAPGYGGTSGKGLFYRWSCLGARAAIEVIGPYPPPPHLTRTPTPAPTSTATVSPTATATATATAAPLVGSLLLPSPSRGNVLRSLGSRPETQALSPESPFLQPPERGGPWAGTMESALPRSAIEAEELPPTRHKDKNSKYPAMLWGLLPAMAGLGVFLIFMGMGRRPVFSRQKAEGRRQKAVGRRQ